jgi:hypothetical protein
MYSFHFDEYLKIALKTLKDTQIEYRYLINKIKLFKLNRNLTESELHSYFKKSRPLAVCSEKSLNNIFDILIKDNDRIHVEYFEDNKKEEVRSSCVPLRIPDRITVLTDRLHKVYDLKHLLHEMGHAISLSYTFPNIELLRAYLYNEVMQEAYADLYENLVLFNQDFRQTNNIKLSQNDIEFLRFEELYNLRFLASKLIYLKEFHLSDNEFYLRMLYKDMMQENLLIHIDNSTYTKEAVTEFTDIQSFIGKTIATRIQENIENNFGSGWYRDKKADEVLGKLFSYGGLVNPDNYDKFLIS